MSKKTPPTDNTPLQSPFAKLEGLRAALPSQPTAATSNAPTTTPKVPKRFAEKVVVRFSKKGHGGKTVTEVRGVLPAFRDELASELKRALGCGARVDGDEILLQGELVERAVTMLEKLGAKNIVRGS